jgi:hypothetical protein
MAAHSDDYEKLLAQQKFLHEIEHGIRVANRDIIHQRISEITEQDVLHLAVQVSRYRAEYLAAAFELARHKEKTPGADAIGRVRARREAYEEAVHAFEALQRAIERGYVDLTIAKRAPKR